MELHLISTKHEFDNIEEGRESNCKHYEKDMIQSFKNCVESVVDNLVIKSFSCIPPWFNDDGIGVFNTISIPVFHNIWDKKLLNKTIQV